MENATKKGRKVKTTKNDFNNPFAVRLRELISERGITQTEVAENISATRQALNKWCNGETYPDILSASEIATYFGVSLDYLIGKGSVRSSNDDIKIACEITGLSENAVKSLHYEYFRLKNTDPDRFLIRNTVILKCLNKITSACLEVYKLTTSRTVMNNNKFIKSSQGIHEKLNIDAASAFDILLNNKNRDIEKEYDDKISLIKYRMSCDIQESVDEYDKRPTYAEMTKEEIEKYLNVEEYFKQQEIFINEEREQYGEHNPENE